METSPENVINLRDVKNSLISQEKKYLKACLATSTILELATWRLMNLLLSVSSTKGFISRWFPYISA